MTTLKEVKKINLDCSDNDDIFEADSFADIEINLYSENQSEAENANN